MDRTGQCNLVPQIMMILARMLSFGGLYSKDYGGLHFIPLLSTFRFNLSRNKRPKFTCVSQNVSILDFFSRTGIEVVGNS